MSAYGHLNHHAYSWRNTCARRDAGRLPKPATYLQEHLTFHQPDGRVVTQKGRHLILEPRRSAYNTRNADVYDLPDPTERQRWAIHTAPPTASPSQKT